MAVAAGVTIGHPCTACEATMAECDAKIKETGAGCCPACFEADTHGLLDKFKVIDVADHAQEIQNLTRVTAQSVLAFTEHAKAIRALRADVAGLIEQVALLRGDTERADEVTKRRLLIEVMTEVRQVVKALPERVQELEDVARALEVHLRIRRKPKEERQKALLPGPPVAKKVTAPIEEDEPKQRRRRRRRDEEDDWG